MLLLLLLVPMCLLHGQLHVLVDQRRTKRLEHALHERLVRRVVVGRRVVCELVRHGG